MVITWLTLALLYPLKDQGEHMIDKHLLLSHFHRTQLQIWVKEICC